MKTHEHIPFDKNSGPNILKLIFGVIRRLYTEPYTRTHSQFRLSADSLEGPPDTKCPLPLKICSPLGIQISSSSHHNGRPHGFPQISVVNSQDKPDRSLMRFFICGASPISTIPSCPAV